MEIYAKILLFFVGAISLISCSSVPDRAVAKNHDLEQSLNLKINKFSSDVTFQQKVSNEREIINLATTAVKNELQDPHSAQFRDLRLVQLDALTVVCGQVNSRNRMGGYTGFQNFIAGTKGCILNFNEPPCSKVTE